MSLFAFTNVDDPIAGALVSAVDANGLAMAHVATDDGGAAILCVPPNVEFSPRVTGASIPTNFIGSFDLSASRSGVTAAVVSTIARDGMVFVFGKLGLTLDKTRALLIAQVESQSGGCSRAGWHVSAALPDGGALSYQTIYVAPNNLPDASLTETTTGGYVMLYDLDIDPAVTEEVVIVASNPDAGACTVQNLTRGRTDKVLVAPGAVSMAAIFLP